MPTPRLCHQADGVNESAFVVRAVVSAAMEAPRVVPVAAGGEAEVVAEAMAPIQREAAVSI